MNIKYVLAAALLVLVVVAATLTLGQEPVTSEQSAKVQLSENKVDFGDIVQSDGPVSAQLTVSNTGTAPLELHKLSTSCGCTTAEMDMSELASGEERELTITFDPMVHPDQFGSIIRVVYLQTSDPDTPEAEIDVIGNVIE